MRTGRVLTVMCSMLVGAPWLPLSGAAQHQHAQAAAQAAEPDRGEQEIEVGKKGEITFDSETIVGELRLKPARYQFQHRVDGSDHFVHFTEVTKGLPSGAGQGIPKAHPGEAKCRLEPLREKSARTAVYTRPDGDARRVTRILVKGENAAHVF